MDVSGLSLLIESTDSMIRSMVLSYVNKLLWAVEDHTKQKQEMREW